MDSPHREATQQGLSALALNWQGIKSLLSLKSKHSISKEIYQSMILQPMELCVMQTLKILVSK